MKALLILLLICINYVLSDNETKYSLKIYPKKVKPGNIQWINAGKYKKSTIPPKFTKKRLGELNEYTVFPLQRRDNREYLVGIPTAYYAPENANLKPRVKKVLPDYVWNLRRKRSAEPDEPKPEEKKVEAVTPKVEAVTVKANVTQASAASTAGTTKAKPKDLPTKKAATTKDKSTKKAATTKDKSTKKAETTKDKPTKKAVTTKNERSRKNNHIQTQKTKPKTITKRKAPQKKLKPQVRLSGSKSKGGKNVKPKAVARKNDSKKTVRSRKGAASKAKPKSNKALRAGKSAKGKQNKRKASRRLIAARVALIEDYPYVVSIQKNNEHWCSGALLNPRLVITTANCMWKSSRLSRMEIRAGSRHSDRGGQLAGISEVMKHPAWGIRKQPDYDVALVLLDRNFRFSDSIHGVDLPNRVMLPPFEDAWVTSWGANRRDGVFEPPETSLQVYHSRILDRGKCNNITERFGVSVTDNFICLAQTGRHAPCTRDSGAPAVSDGVLWGIASWGIRKLCGTERFPAMFSYIGSHANMDFVMNATHYLMADERHYPFPDKMPMMKTRPKTTT